MSRLTGTDALGLFEAYQAVYAPQQELTEEQVWEEVETWVNSLLEEGYDLSEYTWDEVFQIYEETALEKRVADEARIAARRARIRQLEKEGRVTTDKTRRSKKAKEKKAEALEKAADTIISQTRGGSSGNVTNKPPMGAKQKNPAPEATRTLMTGLRRDTLGTAADKILKGVKKEEVEIYKVIVNYLLENNFANTQESAQVIIENMSEEWEQSIIEAYKSWDFGPKQKAKTNRRTRQRSTQE